MSCLYNSKRINALIDVWMCGAAGPYTELIKDVSVRLTPLTKEDVDEMLKSLKTYPTLAGYRGSTPADIRALCQIILRVGKLAEGTARDRRNGPTSDRL